MVLVLGAVVAWFGLSALWIAAMLSVTRLPAGAFAARGRSKGATFALVALTGWLGAGYYWLVIKRELEPYRGEARPGNGATATYV